MWFFKKKPIAALCVEIFDIVATGTLDSYKKYASNLYGCQPEQVEQAVTAHWADYEAGKLKTDEFWDKVGQNLTAQGVKHELPGWKFKGIWQAVVEEGFKLNRTLMQTIIQARDLKLRTIACTNMPSEVATAFQKMGAFEPFNLSVISSQLGARKPSQEFFVRTAKLARLSPAECLLIDKDATSLEIAQSAGYKILAYSDNPEDTRWQLLQLGLLK